MENRRFWPGGLNPIAARGFQSSADAYERGRPDYPAAAVDFLADVCGIRAGAVVLELGAGTGKFTRLLAPTGAALMAVEPVEAMRLKFGALLPDVPILDGSAENIPAADASVDAVLAAQAFHWFNAERALAECRRVLKPGGMVGLIWNVRDESVPWVAEITRIIDVYEKSAPRYKSLEWKQAFQGSEGFGPLSLRSFNHRHRSTLAAFMDRFASVSFIAALPREERDAVIHKIGDLLARHPWTQGQAEIETVYRTDVYWCQKR
ncbi:MAG TPA: methyltransferase domain-containing protein [bacterium]|nr:methyltransferase domain-containing protein [bacterium]